MENQEQEKNVPGTEELTPEQMEKPTGAGFFDSVSCFFSGHTVFKGIQYKRYNTDSYEKLRCERCGKYVYRKNDQDISESEYNAVPFDADLIQGPTLKRKK